MPKSGKIFGNQEGVLRVTLFSEKVGNSEFPGKTCGPAPAVEARTEVRHAGRSVERTSPEKCFAATVFGCREGRREVYPFQKSCKSP